MGYEQWWTWANDAEFKSEWVDGEVIVHMSPTELHAQVSLFLATLLSHFVEFLGLGEVLTETVEMRLERAARVPEIMKSCS